MRIHSRRKLGMYITVLAILKSNNVLWNTIAGFVALVTQFETLITQMRQGLRAQGKDSKGVRTDKEIQEDVLISMSLELAGALVSLSTTEEIKQRARIKGYRLDRLPDLTLLEKFRELHGMTQIPGMNLASFGIDNTWITDYQNKIIAYEAAIPKVRTEVNVKVGATESVEDLEHRIDAMLKTQIDGFMHRFARSQPAFYSQYQSARVIVDQGVHHEEEEEDEVPPQG